MLRALEDGRGPSGSPDPFPIQGDGPGDGKNLRRHVADFDALEALNACSDIPVTFRPTAPGAPHIDIRGLLMPRLAVWTVGSHTGFESIPAEGLDVYSVRIPLRGALLRHLNGEDHQIRAGAATILPARDLVASRFHPGTEVMSCSIAAADLLARHEALEGPDAPLRLHKLASLDGPRLRALVDTIRRIVQHVGTDADAIMGPLLHDVLLNQILSVWPRDQASAGAVGERTVSQAIDYIEAHLGEALTVGDVAAAAGVGVRTLQSAFRAHTGLTPLGYILDRRLERAHADLVANEGRLQVSQIAYRWGFLHLGEFARRYRLRYGCPPSQTGRRAP